MQKITPHLWFDRQAREAAEFYVSLSPGSQITNVTTLAGTRRVTATSCPSSLAGQPFMTISAGPALGGAEIRAVWLAQGPVRPVMADHSRRDEGTPGC